MAGQNPLGFWFQTTGSSTTRPVVGDSATALSPSPGIPVQGVSGTSSALNVTAATVVKAGPGRLIRVTVTTAGAAGAVYDCLTTGAAAAANLIFTVPAVVGVYTLEWPCAVGMVAVPGAAQVLSVSYS